MSAADDPGMPWRDLRLGISVAVTTLVAVSAIMLMGASWGPFLPDTYTLHVDLDDAAGIRVGTPVTVRGVAAGEVADVTIVRERPLPGFRPADATVPVILSATGRNIRLRLSVAREFASQITRSSRAQLANLGLGGERYVRITAGDVRDAPLAPGSTVPTAASIEWDIVLLQLSRALNDAIVIRTEAAELRRKLEDSTGTFGRLMDPGSEIYAAIRAFDAEAKAAMALLEEGAGAVPRWLADGQLKDGLDDVFDDLRAIGRMLDAGDGALDEWVEREALEREIAELRADIDVVRGRLDRGRGTLGRLLNDDELFNQIDVFQQRVEELLADISRDPFRYLHIRLF